MSKKYYIIIFIICLICSCKNNEIDSKFAEIRRISNTNSTLAMRMLDSLDIKSREYSKHTQMQYDLLYAHINECQGITSTSDIKAKALVTYFENDGTDAERQEAYYYAGTTYRDLHDTPRALEYFFKSMDVAQHSTDIDTLLLRNTYSNLHYLYYNVQDYHNALIMAKKELAESLKANNVHTVSLLHLCNSYLALDSTAKAKECMNQTLNIIRQNEISEYITQLYTLLNNYSLLGIHDKANECYNLIKAYDPNIDKSPNKNILGNYFLSIGNNTSAIACYKNIIETDKDTFAVYDATKALFNIYNNSNDAVSAVYYANLFVKTSECLDLGGKQQLATTVSNEFQYHLDRNNMEKAEHSKQIYKRCAVGITFLTIIVSFLVYFFYSKKRTMFLKQQLLLTGKLQEMSLRQKSLELDTERKEMLLREAQLDVNAKEAKLHKINEELMRAEKSLNATKARLEEKERLSQALFNKIHQAELEENASDYIENLRKSALGKKQISEEEWNKIITAVNSLYPNFNEQILKNCGSINEQQIKVCYLMRIGLANPQIKNITDYPRTTIWRWTNMFKWIYETDEKED